MGGAKGGLMGLGDSCHHCQGGAHMLCNQRPEKPLNSQLPMKPANRHGGPVPAEAPAAGSRQAAPVLLRSHGGSGLLSCDCPVV